MTARFTTASRPPADFIERVRDYVVREEETAVDMASWELGLPRASVVRAFAALEKQGIIHVAHPAAKGNLGGPAVYRHTPLPTGRFNRPARFEEGEPTPDLAVASGVPVPTTGVPKGRGGSMGVDKKKQTRGHVLKKPKARGHS